MDILSKVGMVVGVTALCASLYSAYSHFYDGKTVPEKLPMVGQAWWVEGKGTVLVAEVYPAEDRIVYKTKNHKGGWSDDLTTESTLGQFMNYSRVNKKMTTHESAPEKKDRRPMVGQIWEVAGFGDVRVLYCDGYSVSYSYKLDPWRNESSETTDLELFYHYGNVKKEKEAK
jgi:hypothetical protein